MQRGLIELRNREWLVALASHHGVTGDGAQVSVAQSALTAPDPRGSSSRGNGRSGSLSIGDLVVRGFRLAVPIPILSSICVLFAGSHTSAAPRRRRAVAPSPSELCFSLITSLAQTRRTLAGQNHCPAVRLAASARMRPGRSGEAWIGKNDHHAQARLRKKKPPASFRWLPGADDGCAGRPAPGFGARHVRAQSSVRTSARGPPPARFPARPNAASGSAWRTRASGFGEHQGRLRPVPENQMHLRRGNPALMLLPHHRRRPPLPRHQGRGRGPRHAVSCLA